MRQRVQSTSVVSVAVTCGPSLTTINPNTPQPCETACYAAAVPTSTVILNVDDRPPSLYTRERYLRSWGYNVENATTGKAALLLAERLKPNLILLDVHLPDIDGIELCRQLKDDPSLRGIPVLIMSATMRGHTAHLESIRWGGADGFIPEPFDPEELQSTVQRLTGRPHA